MKITGHDPMFENAGLRPAAVTPAAGNPVESFGSALKSALEEVSSLQGQAEQAARNLATGQEVDIHQTMIGMEKADLTFQLLMQVRNKILTAYEEINRMQV